MFFAEVEASGLDLMVILSCAPQWAIDDFKRDRGEFWRRYEQYVTKAASEMIPANTHYVQMWNEANNIVDPIKDEDWKLFQIAGRIIKERIPAAKRTINLFGDLPGWRHRLDQWLPLAHEEIDVVAIDTYPGQWLLALPGRITQLKLLFDYMQTKWPDKRIAMAETGFSSWGLGTWWQERKALNILNSFKAFLKDQPGAAQRMEFAAWYELVDLSNSTAPRQQARDIFKALGDIVLHGKFDSIYHFGIESKFGLIERRDGAFVKKPIGNQISSWIED
jgi:hypothetical protein